MQGQGADETIIGIYEHCSDLSVVIETNIKQ